MAEGVDILGDHMTLIALLIIVFIAVMVLVVYACVAIARDFDDITYYEKGVDFDVDNEETSRPEGEYE